MLYKHVNILSAQYRVWVEVVADAELPRAPGSGDNPKRGRTSQLFGKDFAKNCMKMKERN